MWLGNPQSMRTWKVLPLCLCRTPGGLRKRRGLTLLLRFYIALYDATRRFVYLLLGIKSKVEFLAPLYLRLNAI